MEQFGVSRNSLREAIKMLEALGVVDIRREMELILRANHPLAICAL